MIQHGNIDITKIAEHSDDDECFETADVDSKAVMEKSDFPDLVNIKLLFRS
jgi:hypothetical protein